MTLSPATHHLSQRESLGAEIKREIITDLIALVLICQENKIVKNVETAELLLLKYCQGKLQH